MKAWPAVLLTVIALLPCVNAGSEQDPEMKDLTNDVRWSPLPFSPETAPSPFTGSQSLDAIATWWHDETPATIKVTFLVADLSHVDDFNGPTASYARWGTRFELSNYIPDTHKDWWNFTWIPTVDFNNGPHGWHGYLSAPDRAGKPGLEMDEQYVVDRMHNRIEMTLAKADLGSPKAGVKMTNQISLHDGGAYSGRVHFSDQTDSGRDYVFLYDTPLDAATPQLPGFIRDNATNITTTATRSHPTSTPPLAILGTVLMMAAAWRRHGFRGAGFRIEIQTN